MPKTLAEAIPDLAIRVGPHNIAWTDDNLYLLTAWAWAEDSDAHWNEWDTTLYVPGATPYNTFDGGDHVWDYPDESAGQWAFWTTLCQPQLGDYGPIRAGLAAGDNPQGTATAIARSGWGTEPFNVLLDDVMRNPGPYLQRVVAGS